MSEKFRDLEKNYNGCEKRPRVGIGIMVLNDENQVLLGLRKGAHGAGEWSFPGGHLEFGETVFETARREVREEAGLDIDEFELISVADEMRYIKSDGKHYLNISVLGHSSGGEPKCLEQDRCLEWKWFSLESLPDALFEATDLTIQNYKTGRIYQPAR